jgi:hypothetical protein
MAQGRIGWDVGFPGPAKFPTDFDVSSCQVSLETVGPRDITPMPFRGVSSTTVPSIDGLNDSRTPVVVREKQRSTLHDQCFP